MCFWETTWPKAAVTQLNRFSSDPQTDFIIVCLFLKMSKRSFLNVSLPSFAESDVVQRPQRASERSGRSARLSSPCLQVVRLRTASVTHQSFRCSRHVLIRCFRTRRISLFDLFLIFSTIFELKYLCSVNRTTKMVLIHVVLVR